MKYLVETLKRFLPDFSSKTLLDIGSGPMDKTGLFSLLGFKCSAVDDLGDPWHKLFDNQEKIKSFAKRLEINFYHQQGVDFTVPFPKSSFDVVTLLAVIEHLHSSPRFLLNVAGELLAPGGLLVITMPNAVNLRKRISVMFGRTNYNPLDELYYSPGEYRGHVREYTLAETRRICELSGFEVLHGSHFEFVAQSRLSHIALMLYSAICKFFPALQTGILVVCRKPAFWKPKEFHLERYFESIRLALPYSVPSQPISGTFGYRVES